jgi:hypothetical protein
VLFVRDHGIEICPINLMLCAYPVINHSVVPALQHSSPSFHLYRYFHSIFPGYYTGSGEHLPDLREPCCAGVITHAIYAIVPVHIVVPMVALNIQPLVISSL